MKYSMFPSYFRQSKLPLTEDGNRAGFCSRVRQTLCFCLSSESLAGRIEVLTLWPFSQGEVKGVRDGFIDALFSKQPGWSAGTRSEIGRDELFETILAGGYPPVATR